jgi:hypothetical protein
VIFLKIFVCLLIVAMAQQQPNNCLVENSLTCLTGWSTRWGIPSSKKGTITIEQEIAEFTGCPGFI